MTMTGKQRLLEGFLQIIDDNDNEIIKENEHTENDIPLVIHKEPENVDTELFDALVKHAAKLAMLFERGKMWFLLCTFK